ncbi:MAG TPA: ABC transporter permease [Bryobacteraceae bacterium]
MPDWDSTIREHLAGLNLAGPRESEIVEELSRHMDDRYRELLSSGMPEDRARRLVVDELETRDRLAGQLRQTRQPRDREPLAMGTGGNIMDSVWHDLKVAFRMIRTKPGFSMAVVFMLALGIAGNAAIFSIFNGLFLRPLPFAEPERLVDLDETAPKWNLKYVAISNPDAFAWMRGNTTFDGMAFFQGGGANLSDSSGTAQRIKSAEVTHGLLDVLGLKPAAGRNFTAEEDRPGGAKVAMLGYALWHRLYNGDRNVLGRVLKLNEEPYTVVGVLPREAVLPPDAELWTPLAADPDQRSSFYLSGVGRLKHGVSLDQARADLSRVHIAYMTEHKIADTPTSPVMQPLRDRYLGDLRGVVQILLGGVAVILLIACVNIAGLMLVRGEARTREVAIRTAVGAARSRIVRQFLTESLLLAGLGGVLGVVAGQACLQGLVSLMPDDMPAWIRFDLDMRFALFCLAVTGAAAMLFGLVPALQAATVDTRGGLQEVARATLSRAKRGTLGTLVVGEIALALTLLISSGLLVQAFRKVLHVDPGFRADNVITWNLRLPSAKYAKSEQQLAFYDSLIKRLEILPAVSSVSAASLIPLGGHTGYFFEAEGGVPSKEQRPVILQVTALPGYFETMRMTFLAGQGFSARDEAPKAPPVVVVNEAFARYYWGTTDVVGKRTRPYGAHDWYQVVGVIRNTMHYGLDGEIRPSAIVPFPVIPHSGMSIVMRTAADPHSLVNPAREILRQVDPDLPMFDIRTMGERLDRSLWVRRAYSWLFAAFGAVAIILAATGIYGVISFTVSQRTREIGIRMALGAHPAQVMRGVIGSGMLLVSLGLAVGLLAAQLPARFLKTMLFGVSTRDAVTYLSVVFGVALVGLLANFIPARRAARVDPMNALRAE